MKIWIVNEGKYYHDGTYIDSIHGTKSCAEKQCRADGFKLNCKDNIFENDSEQTYRKIETEELCCDCCKLKKK